jgi:murein endopeptidase
MSAGRALTLLTALLLPAVAAAQGKTYTIKGMGTHYTRKGKELRHAQPFKKVPLVQLKPGPGYVTADPDRAWGTKLNVDTIRRVMGAFEKEYPSQTVIVGDLSKKGGGVLDNHNSHLDGRDVDIHLPLNPLENITDKGPRTPNAGQIWFLLRAFVESCAIEYIFLDKAVQKTVHTWAHNEGVSAKELELILQYPRPERRNVGVVRHWTNHEDHFHVRFVRAPTAVDGAQKAYCDWRKAQRAAE